MSESSVRFTKMILEEIMIWGVETSNSLMSALIASWTRRISVTITELALWASATCPRELMSCPMAMAISAEVP